MMMMHFLQAIVLLLALVKRGQSASLATPFDGKPDNEDASDGDKFSITTKDSAIVLERFDIHMDEHYCDYSNLDQNGM